MDTNVLLVIIISLLSLNLLLVGIYITLVLKDVRFTIQKVNKLLDTSNEMAESLSRPVNNVSGLLESVTSGIATYNLFKGLKKRRSVSSLVDEDGDFEYQKGGRNVRTPF